jgi:hypothetical protein
MVPAGISLISPPTNFYAFSTIRAEKRTDDQTGLRPPVEAVAAILATAEGRKDHVGHIYANASKELFAE